MNHLALANKYLRDGVVLDYEVRDERGDPIICGMTRDEAREFKRECGGIVCQVLVTH